ncbi:MAG: tetratricopeptide repeat protein [Planctomycetota bacterium]|nr:tetratricopeptide repeat protein [Planctomycetota bacterium]
MLLPLVLVQRVPEAGSFTFLQENQPSSQAAASATADDLTRARSLLDEVKAALKSADYEQARAKVQEVVTALLARPDAEQSSAWLALLDDAAHAAHDVRELHSAKAALQRLLEVRSRSLPEEDYELQRARGDLAGTLFELGDPAGARPLFEQALEVCLRTLSEDHVGIQVLRDNLATTIRELGELEEARGLGEQAVEVLSRTRPPDDQYLQSARMNLAGTIYRQGDYEGARALMEKVLASYSRALPEGALNLQRARGNLAATLGALGDPAAERALREKALEAESRMLPDDDPALQLARMDLGNTLYVLGDSKGARALLEKALEVFSRTMPEDNSDLQRARLNFANVLYALGDCAGARTLDEKVLEVCTRTMPDDNGELQIARTCLASDLFAMGEYEKAQALYEKLLEIYARTLPEEHQRRQEARESLALTIESLGDLQRARAIQEEVLALYTRTMPDGHPALQRARGNLTKTIIEQAARARRGYAGAPASEATRADEGRCVELIAALCRGQVQAARAALLSGSSREAEERCAQLSKELDLSISLAGGYGVFQPHAELDRESFVLGETTRGAALTSAALMRMAGSSPRYAETRRALWQASDELAQLAQEGTTNDEFQRALRKREGLERELVSLAQELSGDGQVRLTFDPEALARGLGEHDAVVGLRHYVHTSFETEERPDPAGDPSPTKTSVESLCAFVLRPPEGKASAATGSRASSEPTESFRLTRVELGPSAPIEQAVH